MDRKGKKPKPVGAHPFQLILSSDSIAYVSNQNTKDVRLFDSETGKPLTDGRINGFEDVRGIALYDRTDTLFVAAKKDGLYMMDRGITRASQGENLMNDRYDPQGLLYKPTALLIQDEILYIGNQARKHEGGGNILYMDLSKGEDARIEIFIDNTDDPSFESPSGLAFGPDGKFYVNSREGLQTISYDVVVNVNGTRNAQNAEVFTEHKDQPLGLLWVPIE